MIRIISSIVLLVAAVLWLPLWLQIMLFIGAILAGPYRFLIIIPAIVSDALYAPGSIFSPSSHWMTLLVLVLLALHWFIMKKLRIQSVYGLEA